MTPHDLLHEPVDSSARRRLRRIAPWVVVGLCILAVGWLAWPRFVSWRTAGFIEMGTEKRGMADLLGAEASYRSALNLDPENVAARIELVQVLIDQNQFEAALRESGDTPDLWGGAPDQFVFDSLIKRKDFGRLILFAAEQMRRDPARRIQWLKVAFDMAEITGQPVPVPAGADDAIQNLCRGFNELLRGNRQLGMETLRTVRTFDEDYRIGLLLMHQMIREEELTEAGLAFSRIRHRLSAFEASMGDYRLENALDPMLGDRALRTLLPMANSAERVSMVIAKIIREGSAVQAALMLKAGRETPQMASAQTMGDLWLLGACFDDPTFAQWGEDYRMKFGGLLPSIIGEQLSEKDRVARLKATLLLAGSVPMSRDVLIELFIRCAAPPSTETVRE